MNVCISEKSPDFSLMFSSVSSESFSDRLSVIGSLAPHTAGPPFCVTHEEQKGKHRHTVDSSHTDAQG